MVGCLERTRWGSIRRRVILAISGKHGGGISASTIGRRSGAKDVVHLTIIGGEKVGSFPAFRGHRGTPRQSTIQSCQISLQGIKILLQVRLVTLKASCLLSSLCDGSFVIRLEVLQAILQSLGLILVLVSGFAGLVKLTVKTFVFAFETLYSRLRI